MAARIDTLLGDITKVEYDAIVNAANTSLMGGGVLDAPWALRRGYIPGRRGRRPLQGFFNG